MAGSGNDTTLRQFVGVARIAVVCVAIGLTVSVSAAQFDDFNATQHDRFLGGGAPNPSFILNGYDVSGIARRDNAGGGSAMLISPQHFVTANHFKPTGVGGSLQFQNAAGVVHNATVASYNRLSTDGVGSDISIGTLTAPINPATGINPVPILVGPLDALIGLEVALFGKGDVAGRNIITDTGLIFFNGNPASSPTLAFATRFDTVENSGGDGAGPLTDGLGPDEIGLIGGDSGHSALAIYDGQLLALGAHIAIGSELEDNDPDQFTQDDRYWSFSSYLGEYLDQIDAIVTGDGQTYTTVAIPEPATGLLLAGGVLLAARRRRSL